MKRLVLAGTFCLAFLAPAHAVFLLDVRVAAPVTAQVSPTFHLRAPSGQALAANLLLQGTFTYGSGGTSADAWVQTSIDGGTTWIDVANFHFAKSSARFLYNLSSATPVSTEYTPTDGTLAANTSKDGLIGPIWRVKYTIVGNYADGTTLRIDAFAQGITSFHE
jgi:hypothetical protein